MYTYYINPSKELNLHIFNSTITSHDLHKDIRPPPVLHGNSNHCSDCILRKWSYTDNPPWFLPARWTYLHYCHRFQRQKKILQNP